MEQEEDKPIAREPWQRLLRERYDAPSEVTDMRIHAAARRALVPRPARWWLPASLAASVLLAILLVQWQFGGERSPGVVNETDVVAPVKVVPRDEVKDEYAAPAAVSPPAPPAVAPPMIDLPATESPATAITRERQEAAAPDEIGTAGQPMQDRAPVRAESPRSATAFGALHKSGAEPRTPEEWYAKIEALRAAGLEAEADAELKRLEAAWPGWLEKNHPPNR
jgi:hypothetical protein